MVTCGLELDFVLVRYVLIRSKPTSSDAQLPGEECLSSRLGLPRAACGLWWWQTFSRTGGSGNVSLQRSERTLLFQLAHNFSRFELYVMSSRRKPLGDPSGNTCAITAPLP